ncbi:MAG: hypothetical protein WC802_05615, partial [Patescibacteria group bacterium]
MTTVIIGLIALLVVAIIAIFVIYSTTVQSLIIYSKLRVRIIKIPYERRSSRCPCERGYQYGSR